MSWSPFLAAIVALALAIWAACYLLGSPLDGAETVVVVGLSAVLVCGVRALLRRLRKAPAPAAPEARSRAPSKGRPKNRRRPPR